MIKKLLIFLVALILMAIAFVAYFSLLDQKQKYEVSAESLEIPEFTAIEVDFTHNYEAARGLPFTAGALIDVDNDGDEELFLGGGVRQADGLFVLLDDHFVNVVDQANLVKQGDDITLGAVALDFDKNGYQDLIISRERGIWLYRNDQGKFSVEKLDIPIAEGVAPLAVAVADLNRDGYFDFFVPVVPRTSMMGWLSGSQTNDQIKPMFFLNNGDDTFYDMTESVGLQNMSGALQAIFADLDGDELEDLTVLHVDGFISIWKNIDNLLFENKPSYHTSLDGNYGAMSIADLNGDGSLDIFLSNSGSTIPGFFSRLLRSQKDVKYSKWIQLNNTGFFSFRDVAERSQLANYELSRGILFTDLNGDNLTDLVVAQNHPYWPPYLIKNLRLSGKVLLQNSSGQFTDITAQSGVNNGGYGVAPLTTDFNKDGRPDLIFINLGGKSKVYLSKPGKNNYLKVQLADVPQSLGALVEVKTLSGKRLKKRYLKGTELCSDSTHILYFGLNNDKATDVVVEYPNEEKDIKSGVLVNTTVVFD